MPPLFTASDLDRVRQAELDWLAQLDARGLPPGPGEDAAAFARRLETLSANLDKLEAELAAKGQAEVAGLTLPADRRIHPELVEEAGAETERLFAFRVDWVPGFYVNPKHAWLFGGCAFFDNRDYFALFVIRHAFARQPRWFLYNRRELLAHELTHVARMVLNNERYEERFAYQTAETPFRRALGCVFRTPWDSALLLASVFLLTGSRVAELLWLPALPAWPFWLLTGGAVGYLAWRHQQSGGEFTRALAQLQPAFGARALAVLCRCHDGEIQELARLQTPAARDAWLDARRAAGELRWRVLFHRFAPPPAAAHLNTSA